MMIDLQQREYASVLLALRYWQKAGRPGKELTTREIDRHLPLADAQIDNLCDQINVEYDKRED